MTATLLAEVIAESSVQDWEFAKDLFEVWYGYPYDVQDPDHGLKIGEILVAHGQSPRLVRRRVWRRICEVRVAAVG